MSAAQGAPPAVHSPAPASPGALPSSTSPQTTSQQLAKDGDLAGVAQDLGREAALAAFAAMRKEKTKFSTRIATTKAPVFQFSEERSTSGIFKSSNPISTRPKAVPMDEDKTQVEETKAADAAMDSAPIGVKVTTPPVEEADMETAVESAGPAHVVAPEVPTAGTIEAIVMAEPTPTVEEVSVPVMELEPPVSITVVEPAPSYFQSSSPLFDIADIYADLDLAASFCPPLLAGPDDIFDLSAFPEAQFVDDLPSWESFAGLTPAVSVPAVSPTPAAAPSAYTADDEAMLVDDEWAMDGVWPSGVAISYHYSEFDIVVDTPADMAAAERDRIAWVKQCRASEPVAIEADEEEIPGLNLPPPTSSPAFRCASFEWKNLDLGLPGSSLYSPPSPGSDSDSSDGGPPTPKDVYDPYDPEEIALYGGFNDGLTK